MTRRTVAAARTALLLCPLVLTCCVKFGYSRRAVEEPLAAELLDALAPGRDSLQDCLNRLGAPLQVYEQPGDGMAMSYGWLDESGWGVSASYSLNEFASASASFDNETSDAHGVVLIFDGTRTLRMVRKGFLREITADLGTRRPQDVSSD